MLDRSQKAPAFDTDRLADILAGHLGRAGALLPILHDVMAEFGHVEDAMVPAIAEALNLSRAEIHGVVTFYHDFRREPAGRRVVKLCAAEACQAMGGRKLAEHAAALLGTAMGSTGADGSVTLEPIYCLGLCSVAPAAQIDGCIHGRLTPERLETLLSEVAR